MSEALHAPQAVRVAFRAFVEANVPVVLRGPPGIGKTVAVRACSASLRWPLYEIVPATREPADFGGYPLPDGKRAVRLVPVGDWPAFAARVEQAGGNGILFLDEIGQCSLAVQNALLRVVLDRVVGEFPLPPGVRIVCAANPADQAGGWDLSPAFANRLAHLDWPVPSVDEWIAWMATTTIPRTAQYLVAHYLAARPSLLLAVPSDDAARGAAWPSPRSWTRCAEALGHVLAAEVDGHFDAELAIAVAAATVGTAAAASFGELLRGVELADPESILADPVEFGARVEACAASGRFDLVWHGLTAVAYAVLSRLDEQRWLAAWEVHRVAREANAGGAAIAALARTLARAALPAHGGVPAGPACDLPRPEEMERARRTLAQVAA